MEEKVVEQPIVVHRPVMPRRLDRRVRIELEDRICALFSREVVPCSHVREIKDDPHIFDIWCTLPRDMMTLMHHVVNSLTLIQSLLACTQSMSYPQSDEIPDDAHHDYLPPRALEKQLTSLHSPSHVSLGAKPFIDPPPLHCRSLHNIKMM